LRSLLVKELSSAFCIPSSTSLAKVLTKLDEGYKSGKKKNKKQKQKNKKRKAS